MAIATLADLYNNPLVFTGVVKIRKGLAVRLINGTQNEEGLHKWFYRFASRILSSIPKDDPNSEKTRQICQKIKSLTEAKAKPAITQSRLLIFTALLPFFVAWAYPITFNIFQSAYSLLLILAFVMALFYQVRLYTM